MKIQEFDMGIKTHEKNVANSAETKDLHKTTIHKQLFNKTYITASIKDIQRNLKTLEGEGFSL